VRFRVGAWVALGLILADAASCEVIRRFEVEIEFTGSDAFRVEERILYDFEAAERRGIYRDIPVAYGRGQAADYRIGVDVESVEDATGSSRPHRTSSEGRDLRIRIGDPKRRVSGAHDYRIRYAVRRGLLYFDDHDELYWNVTGDAWKVPIESARLVVRLPAAAAGREVRVGCFTGPRGSVERTCLGERRDGEVVVEAGRLLKRNEGLTAVLWLEPGILVRPTAFERFLSRASDFLDAAMLIPLATLLLMLELWRRRGRDPEPSDAIPVRYEPPEGLTPAEVGTLVDERADLTDITATILDLAVRRHLQIEEVPSTGFFNLSGSDYILRRGAADESDLREHEKRVMLGLFSDHDREVRVSQLRNSFYTRLPGIREALYRRLTRVDRFFPTSPERVRELWTILGVVLGGVGIVLFMLQEVIAIAWGISVIAAGVAVLAFSRFMPRKTKKGRRAYEQVLGLREFIERVDRDRLERMGGRTASQFERILPFAIVLGLADEWSNAFDGIYEHAPDWYVSPGYGGHFDTRIFVRDVGHSMQTLGKAMTSQPKSSGSGSSGFGGGGFSGGGFGGGGGGSW
jgi:uncharacterized membrane protein YgcG